MKGAALGRCPLPPGRQDVEAAGIDPLPRRERGVPVAVVEVEEAAEAPQSRAGAVEDFLEVEEVAVGHGTADRQQVGDDDVEPERREPHAEGALLAVVGRLAEHVLGVEAVDALEAGARGHQRRDDGGRHAGGHDETELSLRLVADLARRGDQRAPVPEQCPTSLREQGTRLGVRDQLYKRLDKDRHWEILSALTEIATELGASPAQTALAWLLHKSYVTSVIFGVRSLQQLDENLAAAELKLSPGQMAILDKASALELEYPYNFISAVQGRW